MKITIYHTNDIHADFNKLKRVHWYINKYKKEQDLYLDSGDFIDLQSLVIHGDRGKSAYELFNSCKVDYSAIGNNEIDLGQDDLIARDKEISFLSCNLFYADGSPFPGVKPYTIIERQGVRFLIIGISPYYTYSMIPAAGNIVATLYGLATNEPMAIIEKILQKEQGNYDFSIWLSHSGMIPEHNFMKKLPVDLVLGGHSHDVFQEENYSQSGKGDYIGKTVLEIVDDKKINIIYNNCREFPLTSKGLNPNNPETNNLKNIVNGCGLTEPVDNSAFKNIKNSELECFEDSAFEPIEDPEFDAMLKEREAKADALLSESIGAIGNLSYDAFEECPLVNFICDCLYEHFGGDLALINNGIASFDLTKDFTKKDLILCMPSKLNPTTYKVKGKQILEAYRLSLDPEHIRIDGHGPGFRGKVLGTLSFSHNVKADDKKGMLYINGQEIEAEKEYTIITDDYLFRGKNYPSLKGDYNNYTQNVWFIRDAVLYYIKDEKIYKQSEIRRKL